ncbi:hypothetical protein SAMN05443287_105231 [Micromonospora phaseoli]|uniref:Uncharacterized protein n=1 Tax=Micromonospora phaseoli TaxID=1144548 RepID=A0A1H6ZQA5_9ACTN|nr:hypothetical protein [Micromonospora phaseoli]PZV97073.1 hypothetical protein CLV64_106181 [Micromonospora phaseoli]GIJ77348.1 hypothetical protein Xph01_17800 [Micromonospora phaseoli]SEJ55551.1 hypothetical protein SAMN05443287_105231 [Micromonospora phaseoli]
MGYRGRDARPRLALWTAVVLGTVVLLVAAVGVAVLATLVSLVTLAGAGLAGWHLTRRGSVSRGVGTTVPVALAARRRA